MSIDHLALLYRNKETEKVEVYEATQKDVIIKFLIYRVVKKDNGESLFCIIGIYYMKIWYIENC